MPRAKQPVSIENIEFDALIDLDNTLESSIPSYPVEKGFEISDGIILKPQTLSMTLFVGLAVTWISKFGSNPARAGEVEQKLRELYFKRQPVTVITTDRTYSNMAITSISFKKSPESGYSLEVPISFQEIRVTQSQTTTIPDSYGRSGATGTNAGTASVTTATAQTSGGNDNSSEATTKESLAHYLIYNGGLEKLTNVFTGGDE